MKTYSNQVAPITKKWPYGIVGEDEGITKNIEIIEKAAQYDVPVLVSGETGTGKNLFASAFHERSKRNKKPFIVLNCGELSEDLFLNELFGHVRGSFTGAVEYHKGIVFSAEGGTLVLDEIGDLSSRMQASLLKMLDTKEARPLGSTEYQRVDVRIIACCNKDLKKMILNGEFRQDLYFRFAKIAVNLPPLRNRCEDIECLVEHFFEHTLNKRIKLNTTALKHFKQYQWPGNIRELYSYLDTLVIYEPLILKKGIIEGSDIIGHPFDFQFLGNPEFEDSFELKTIEREAILRALDKFKWNKVKSAQALGICKSTLYEKICKFEIMKKTSTA